VSDFSAKIRKGRVAAVVSVFPMLAISCGGSDSAPITNPNRPSVVVTYSILGAVVSDVVGDAADVIVLMPNGSDPHEWQPSAKDIEKLQHADLVVTNGLGLEAGLVDVLKQAQDDHVDIFVATDHILPRRVGEGEGADPTDEDQSVGAKDPHIWTDPLVMAEVVRALGEKLSSINIEVSEQAAKVSEDLLTLDHNIKKSVSALDAAQRLLITGHESLGYFARRYEFTLIGAIIPNLSSKSEASAADMTSLVEKIKTNQVQVIFTELGTSGDVADSLAKDAGVKVIEISTHVLPNDGSYETFITNLASTIVTALKS
jgi:zinc/manganese transport system substrate-binding protein